MKAVHIGGALLTDLSTPVQIRNAITACASEPDEPADDLPYMLRAPLSTVDAGRFTRAELAFVRWRACADALRSDQKAAALADALRQRGCTAFAFHPDGRIPRELVELIGDDDAAWAASALCDQVLIVPLLPWSRAAARSVEGDIWAESLALATDGPWVPCPVRAALNDASLAVVIGGDRYE